MGNSFGAKRKTTKIMKMNGETIRFKTPVYAADVVKDYPGLVLLDSDTVKNYGIRAKPLEPQEELKAKRLYFLVEMPKLPEDNQPSRRIRSGIDMNARERLESLKLARRSASDLTFMKSSSVMVENGDGGEPVRMKLRVPKAEVERLMKESKDETEAAERIMRLCMEKSGGAGAGAGAGTRDGLTKGRRKRVGFSEELTVREHTW